MTLFDNLQATYQFRFMKIIPLTKFLGMFLGRVSERLVTVCRFSMSGWGGVG